jgi:FMN phosphatase YigB (HAD superfamily)
LRPLSTRFTKSIFDGVKALIFDLDGTLYDYRRLAVRLIMARPRDLLLAYTERLTRKSLTGCDFGASDIYFKAFFDKFSRISRQPEEALRDWYFSRYMPLMCGVLKKHYTPYPVVADLFDLLESASIPFGVYSDYPLIGRRLKALGLSPDRCGGLFGPENFGAQKPAPRPFRMIAAALGSGSAETLVVGDRNDTDGAGALAAGMRFFRIRGKKRNSAQKLPGYIPVGSLEDFYEGLLRHVQGAIRQVI